MAQTDLFGEFEERMRGAGMSDAAILAFRHNYRNLAAGQTGLIPEDNIQPVSDLPRLEEIGAAGSTSLLAQTVLIKLNGGLGTSMGLERAKSLLQVKNGLAFLDFIVNQVLHLRQQHAVALRFLLMNSFSTSRDTLDFMKRYSGLGPPASLELMQNQVPKVDAQTLRPVSWPENRQLEWCPPGHGDIFPALLGSGWLDRLVADGARYLFVSNADNLGASLDLPLLSWFAESGLSFLMEVAERTASDSKGGHLAQRAGRLLLRESAQCPKTDEASFQDIGRHRFFNTNNLWIRLDHLKAFLNAQGGFIPLPMIKNAKTVDPRKKDSPAVFQLETAMGAAIESFERAGAILVPRTRFAPVKTTSDLMALRSDAYEVSEDWRVMLAAGRHGRPPKLDLDPAYYKLAEQVDAALAAGAPSLRECDELVVRGPVVFNPGNVFLGSVRIHNPGAQPKALPPGRYENCSREL